MVKFLAYLFVVPILLIHNAFAYEFKHLNLFFDALQQEYAEQTNIKELTLEGSKVLTKIDKKLSLFNSDSKAFLYKDNKLVSTFTLPANTDLSAWKHTFVDILSEGAKYSSVIAMNLSELEQTALAILTHQLDKYSRIEKSYISSSYIDYTLKDNVLYVRLDAFRIGCTEQLKYIISQFPHIDGITLDLRDNHGGQFNEAIKIADLFLDEAIITYSEEKNHSQHLYTSTKGDIIHNKPIAILTNEYTASAAEIVVAALSEQSRATVIGTKTYGKGSIQNTHIIGTEKLYLTSGQFFSPSGKVINERGIFPQICTGTDQNCFISNKSNPQKDILLAIDVIKKRLS